MLLLTRKEGESVDLHDTRTNEPIATVTVCALLPNGVIRIGFEAPPHVRILRDNAKNKEE